MARFLLGRGLRAFITVVLVVILTFFLSRLSGDPTSIMLPDTATVDDIARYRAALGLDAPIPVQLWKFIEGVAHLDFGNSIRSSQPAFGFILERLPASLELAGASFILSLVLALGFGILNEMTQSAAFRSFVLAAVLVREAIPTFVFGLLLIYGLGVQLNLFPFIGDSGVSSFVLPVLTLGSATLALYLRLMRSGFEEERRKHYARTAIAKGATRWHLVVHEMFPNVLLPFITIVALNFGLLIVGSVIVESVFSWPGVAHAIVDAVGQRDFPVIQAGVVVMSTIFILVNLAADLAIARIDPRIRI